MFRSKLTIAFFVLAMLTIGVFSVSAQEQLTDLQYVGPPTVEKFFTDCLESPPMYSPDDSVTEAFCACSAANLDQYVKKEREKKGNNSFRSSAGEWTEDVLIADIYGSCLYIPHYDEVYSDCNNEERWRVIIKKEYNRKNYCHCYASRLSEYVEIFAADFLKKELALDLQKVVEPLGFVKRSTEYGTEERGSRRDCFKEWAQKKHY